MSDRSTEINRVLDAPQPTLPVPRGPVPQAPSPPECRSIEITIDGKPVSVAEGSTILDAAKKLGIHTPTLCFLQNLTPVNVCRVCVVELEGSRTLVPACSRKVEPNMSIRTDSERVRHSRHPYSVTVKSTALLRVKVLQSSSRCRKFSGGSNVVAVLLKRLYSVTKISANELISPRNETITPDHRPARGFEHRRITSTSLYEATDSSNCAGNTQGLDGCSS